MSAGFDEDYFRTLYGEDPRQTRWDRARDDLVVRMVEAHAPRPGDGAALLDIGCGYGYLLSRFRHRYLLFGIDVSVHAARQAAVRLPAVRVVQADVQRPLPFREPFDVVLAINVVEHLPDPAAGARSIREALRPGGLCVVHLPTINNAVSRAIYRLAYAADPTHIYRPSGEEVRAVFEDAGFETVAESYAPHTPWLLPGFRWHPAFLAAFRVG